MALAGLLLAFGASWPSARARGETLEYVTVKLQNAGDQPLVLTMHDDRDGRTFVVRVGAKHTKSISLQSSRTSEKCCGSISWESSAGNRHRDGLKDGDVVQVP